MGKDIFDVLPGTEPYMPGLRAIFLRPDENEAGRLLRRATELPLNVARMNFDNTGAPQEGVLFKPYEDIQDPDKRYNLLTALDSITDADEVSLFLSAETGTN